MAPHRGTLILLIQVTCDRLKAFAGGGTAYKTVGLVPSVEIPANGRSRHLTPL